MVADAASVVAGGVILLAVSIAVAGNETRSGLERGAVSGVRRYLVIVGAGAEVIREVNLHALQLRGVRSDLRLEGGDVGLETFDIVSVFIDEAP